MRLDWSSKCISLASRATLLRESMADMQAPSDDVGVPQDGPSMPCRAEYSHVTLESEALRLLQGLVERQLCRAGSENAQPNSRIPGDGDVYKAFWLLLTPETQRVFFLTQCRNRHFWPRIRGLVGNPPYAFLRSEDNSAVNPGGIVHGRINLAPVNTCIFNSNQIGQGHFSDRVNRCYRIVADDHKHSREIPTIRVRMAKRVVLDVKLPRMKTVQRASIAKQNNKNLQVVVQFPKVGDVLQLEVNKSLGGDVLTLTVRSVQQRAQKSPVCRLYCTR